MLIDLAADLKINLDFSVIKSFSDSLLLPYE